MTEKTETLLREIQKEQKAQRKMLVTLLARTSPGSAAATADDVAKQLREVLGEDTPTKVYEDLGAEILRSANANASADASANASAGVDVT